MDLLTAIDRGAEAFGRRVHQVGADQWGAPTPCRDWSVRDLVNHLTSEHLWAPWLLRGAALEEVGDRFEGDVLGEDPVGSWDRAVAGSLEAFHEPRALSGSVHTSAGPTPADEYARQMVIDLTVHAWDLARGIGADDRLDEELAGQVYAYAERRAPAWAQLGIFDPAVPVPASAPVQDRLVALTGRRP